ncbi:SWI/SNF chromatin-remodeling complex subunit [Rhodotorula kratochvilovae]
MQPYPPPNGALPHPALNGYAHGSPAMMHGAVPLPGMGNPAAGTPTLAARRLSASAGPGASYGYAGTPTQLGALPQAPMNAHQQALLMRSQQAARAPPVASTSGTTAALAPPPPPATLPNDGGPAYKVPVHRSFTRVRETEPGEEFPSIPSAQDQERLKAWIERDVAYETELVQAKHAMRIEASTMHEELMKEQDWLGYPAAPVGFRPRTKAAKQMEEAKGKRGALRKPVPMSKSYLRSIAQAPETLIPIRLELEHEMYKLRDTFTWNLRETTITPEIFASHLCADMRLPPEHFQRDIIAAVTKQIADAQLSGNYHGHIADALEEAREESRAWLEAHASRRRRLGKEPAREGEEGEEEEQEEEEKEEKPAALAELKVEQGVSDELRVAIKLDITLDSIQLVDKFEWDLSDPYNSPEAFAETFAADLGLTGEFRTAIAHSIREQVEFYTRSLCILGYTKGAAITEDDLRRDFLPSVGETFRTDTADDFTPLLNQLTADEVERFDREHEREIRRKRRQTKGRGVTLPERESVRTHRTLVPRSLPGHVSYYRDERDNKHYPQPELSLPYPIVAKAVAPKPADLETNSASPLKLLLTKDKAGGAGGLAATAAANRYKKGQEGAAGGLESPVKQAPVKKRLPGRPNLEALGLHEHIVDGQWFCANCGCPASVAVGRRKGPTGKDSLCGTCGKYFHRFKRQRPCTYTRDHDTHQRQRAEEEARNPTKTRKKTAAAAAAAAAGAAAELLESAARSARTSGRGTPASQALSPQSSGQEDDSDEDEDDEPVLARGVKRRRPAHYGSPDTPFVQLDSDDSEQSSAEGSPPATRQRVLPATQLDSSPPPVMPNIPAPAAIAAPAVVPAPQPLPWMLSAAAELRAKQVDDRFEIIPRPRPSDPNVQEWRIRCLDCPGKLYNLGPGETLDGFLVHFKNRVHRSNVEARIARET